MPSSTEYVWGFQNNTLWDAPHLFSLSRSTTLTHQFQYACVVPCAIVIGCAFMIFPIIYACLFRVSGTEVRVPSLVKRASAEVIDCLILLLVKFFISYLLIHYGGFKWVSVIHGTLTIEQFYHYWTFPSIVSLHLLPSNISFLHQRTNEKFALDRAVSLSGR